MEINNSYTAAGTGFLTLPKNRESMMFPSISKREERSSIGAKFFSLMKPSVSRSITESKNDPSFLSIKKDVENITKTYDKDDLEALKKSCDDFEAILTNFLLTEMKKTVNKSGMFGEDKSSYETFDSMLNSEMAKSLSQSGSLGISESMYNQLTNTMPSLGYSLGAR